MSRPEPAAVFTRAEERLDHLSFEEVPIELIKLTEPEVIAVEVIVRRIRATALVAVSAARSPPEEFTDL
jgi:hypothetical protein